MHKPNNNLSSPKFTLDKKITVGFLVMLALMIMVSGFCIYTIKSLKNSKAELNGNTFSLYEIIEENTDDTVFESKTLLEAIKFTDKQIGIAYLNVVIVAFISIFFGGLVTILFPKRITRPVLNLVKATNEVMEGNYTHKVPDIRGSNEITLLINSFNAMLDEIRENRLTNKQLLEKTKNFNNELQIKIKEVEKELKETNLELSRNERLAEIGQIIFRIAHEIKNPLSGISVALQNLKSDVENKDNKDTIIEIIDEINRLDNIVKELFHLALPNELELVKTDPREIIEKALNLVKFKEGSRKENINVETNFNTDTNSMVKIDQDQILQVLINIIKNSVDSIKGSDGKIIINTHRNKEYFEIHIKDNGKGIKDKDLIFQPFYTTKRNGSGLGLPISKTIIEKHGGELQVRDSGIGNGSEFIIKFRGTV